jgi:hypothetical protein
VPTQELHLDPHALSQQTPSTHSWLAHCEELEQAAPCTRSVQGAPSQSAAASITSTLPSPASEPAGASIGASLASIAAPAPPWPAAASAPPWPAAASAPLAPPAA